MSHATACEQTLTVALAEGTLDPNRDALGIETVRGLARALDDAENTGKGYAALATSLKGWWPVLLRKDDSGGISISDWLASVDAAAQAAASPQQPSTASAGAPDAERAADRGGKPRGTRTRRRPTDGAEPQAQPAAGPEPAVC